MSGPGKQHSWKEDLRGCPQGVRKTSELGTAAKGRQDKTMGSRGDQGEEVLEGSQQLGWKLSCSLSLDLCSSWSGGRAIP